MTTHRTPRLSDVENGKDEAPATAWWRGAVIAGLALAMALGGIALLWLLARPLALLLLAIVIAEALSPIVARLDRWLPRNLAIVLVYVVLALIIGGLGWLVVPPLVAEGQQLVMNSPQLIEQWRQWLNGVVPESANRVMATVQSGMTRFTDTLISLPFTIFASAIDVLLVTFMSLYWLIAMPALHRFTLSLFPEDVRGRADNVLGAMGDTMGGYVRGTVIDGIIIGAITYVGLLVIGLEYPLVLAVITGIGELVPVVGPIFAAIPVLVIALLHSPQQAITVAVFFLVLQQLESNILVPYIMRNQADVPPLLSLFAVTAGAAVGGVVGALAAIPLIAALRILVLKVVAPAEREWSGADEHPLTEGQKRAQSSSGDQRRQRVSP